MYIRPIYIYIAEFESFTNNNGYHTAIWEYHPPLAKYHPWPVAPSLVLRLGRQTLRKRPMEYHVFGKQQQCYNIHNI